MNRYLTLFWTFLFVAYTTVAFAQSPAVAQKPKPKLVVSSTATQKAKLAGFSNQDVLDMLDAGLSEDLVIGSIRKASVKNFDLTPAGMIQLKQKGVSDAVIRVMLDPNSEPAVPVAISRPPVPAPVPVLPEVTEVTLQDGSEVRLRLLKSISSATARVDDRVEFEAIEDVSVKDVVVIKKGATATGRVTEAQGKKSFGRRGKLNFTVDSVKGVDGQNIRLRATRETKGDESYGKAGVVTIIAGPFGALVKGKDVELSAGTEYIIYIDGDRTIKLARAGK